MKKVTISDKGMSRIARTVKGQAEEVYDCFYNENTPSSHKEYSREEAEDWCYEVALQEAADRGIHAKDIEIYQDGPTGGGIAMSEQPKLGDLSEDELRQILKSPIELSEEAAKRTEHFNELLERTARVGPEDLNLRLR